VSGRINDLNDPNSSILKPVGAATSYSDVSVMIYNVCSQPRRLSYAFLIDSRVDISKLGLNVVFPLPFYNRCYSFPVPLRLS